MSARRDATESYGTAVGLLILHFITVYAPAFALAGSVSRSPIAIIPIIIVVSLGVAVGWIAFFIGTHRMSVGEFGLRFCALKYIAAALVVGLPLGVAVAWCTGYAHETGPFGAIALPIGISILYFGIGAPIQEEVIFRGLLQSVLTKSFGLRNAPAHVAPLIVAMLFAVIHLEVGPVTAVCALVLGVACGELRLRSSSLLPAVVVHTLFNLCNMFWPQ